MTKIMSSDKPIRVIALSKSVNQVGLTGALTPITFINEVRKDDNHFAHSTSVNPQNITVLIAGWYKISYNICFQNTAGGNNPASYRCRAYKNGALILGSMTQNSVDKAANTPYASCSATFYVECAANDIIIVQTDGAVAGGAFGSGCSYTAQIDSSFLMERK